MKTPRWQIDLGGQIVDVNERLLSMTLTDNRGLVSDTLNIELADYDQKLILPSRGVRLSVSFGYKNETLVYRGSFVVDSIRHGGPPDVLKIEAKSADFNEMKFLAGAKRSWHKKPLGAICKTLAGENGLKCRVGAALAGITIAHIDQTESDAHFLTRLAEEYDAVATVKSATLLFLPIGACETADGKKIAEIVIDRREIHTHDFATSNQQRYSGVKAFYHSAKSAKKHHVDVGSDGHRKHLKAIYPNKARAAAAAASEWQRLQRLSQTISLDVADAPPTLFAETPLRLTGMKPEINAINWLIVRSTLTIDKSGMSAKIDAERRL